MKKFIIAIVIILTTAVSASAQGISEIPPIPKPDYLPGTTPTNTQDVAKYGAETQDYFVHAVSRFTNGFLGTVTAIALLMLIVSGIQMLAAFGEEEKLTNAKKTATWAILGLVLALLGFAIVNIINTLPITQLQQNQPQTLFIPKAYAADPNLLPNEYEFIYNNPESQAKTGSVRIPAGDLLLDLLPAVIKILLGIAGSLALLGLSLGAFLLVTAQGNEDQIGKGKLIILWTVIAMLIISVAYGVIFGIASLDLGKTTPPPS